MSFGFLVGDNLPGPFSLELDYIKVGLRAKCREISFHRLLLVLVHRNPRS